MKKWGYLLTAAWAFAAMVPTAEAGCASVTNFNPANISDFTPLVGLGNEQVPLGQFSVAIGSFPGMSPAQVRSLGISELLAAFVPSATSNGGGGPFPGAFSVSSCNDPGMVDERIYTMIGDAADLASSTLFLVYDHEVTFEADAPPVNLFNFSETLGSSTVDPAKLVVGSVGLGITLTVPSLTTTSSLVLGGATTPSGGGVTVNLTEVGGGWGFAPSWGELDMRIVYPEAITGGTVRVSQWGFEVFSSPFEPGGTGFVGGDAHDGTYQFSQSYDFGGEYQVEVEVVTAAGTTDVYGPGNLAFTAGSVDMLWLEEDPCFIDPWSPGCGGGGWEEYSLSSLSVTPGVANVTSAAQTLTFRIDYSSVMGSVPTGSVTLRPPSTLFSPIVVDLANTTHTPDGALGGTFTFTREFAPGTLSGQWQVDVLFEWWDEFNFITLEFPFSSAGVFTVQDDSVGGAPDNPILPDEVTPDGGFRFNDFPQPPLGVDWPLWPRDVDPPMAFGYLYEIENGATITGIANLPPGIDADGMFTVFAPAFEKAVSVSDAVDFVTELGAGTKWFAITGIEPGVDGADNQAFPIRVAFDSQPVLKVTPLLIPELGLAVTREGAEMVATLSWQGQDELEYQLYRSTDLRTWLPAGEAIPGEDGAQSVVDRSSGATGIYRLGLRVPTTP